MSIETLRTKVILPRRRNELVSRERLFDLWDELIDYKLILVTAPAGYGKTSLLVDIAHTHVLPFCWYSLDALDQDLQRFIAYFVASIDQRFADFKESSIAVMRAATQGGFTPEQLARLCADEVYRTIREHFVIVLDDFHLIDKSKAVNGFINRFVQDVDDNCHLVLVSRSLIPLIDLPLLVSHSQVGGLGYQELSFRPEEIQLLLFQNYNFVVPSVIAEELASETEGWITGLLLSAQTMYQGMADRVRIANVSGIDLQEYLLHQVLDQQAPELRDFLLHTSIFDEFDPDLCKNVLGSPEPWASWQEILEEILQNNLFILQINEEPTCLRYHHLFRDFLQNQLSIEQPEKQTQLLQRLGAVYLGRQDWDRAFAIYQRLEDVESIADILEESGEKIVKSGRVEHLEKLLDSIPLVILISRPSLLALRGIVAAALGETQRGLSLLDQAIEILRGANDQHHLIRALVRRAWIYLNQSNHSASQADADEALLLTQDIVSLIELRAEALRIRGLNLRLIGDLDQAICSLIDALELYYKQADLSSVTRVTLALGATYLEKGDLGLAKSCYESACSYYRKENDYFSLSSVLNDLAFLHHICGDYRQASTYYEEALVQARRSNNLRAELMILSGLGDLYVDIDTFQAAEEVYQDALVIAHRLDHHYMELYLYLAKAALARQKGEIALSHRNLDVAESMSADMVSEHALALFQLENGRLALTEKDLSGATTSLTKALELFIKSGQRLYASQARFNLAVTYFKAGDINAASTNLFEALHLVSVLDRPHILVPAARQARALLDNVKGSDKITVQIHDLIEQVNCFERDIPKFRRYLRHKKNILTLAPPRMRIQALGRTRVYLDKKLITRADWQTQVTRDLFYLLLTNPQGWTKEEIGEILWPESSPAQLKLRFKNTIYRLRRALGRDAILFDEEIYTFNRQLDYEYDVESFREALEKSKRSSDLNDRIFALREATNIYQGDYLLDVDYTWVLTEREHLRQMYIDASLTLAEIHLDRNENDIALRICSNLITNFSSLEEAHRLAMRVHAALGNRAAVIQQYDLLKQVLLEDLDTTPSSLTQSLYQSLTR